MDSGRTMIQMHTALERWCAAAGTGTGTGYILNIAEAQ
jgi:hypothetical protein